MSLASGLSNIKLRIYCQVLGKKTRCFLGLKFQRQPALHLSLAVRRCVNIPVKDSIIMFQGGLTMGHQPSAPTPRITESCSESIKTQDRMCKVLLLVQSSQKASCTLVCAYRSYSTWTGSGEQIFPPLLPLHSSGQHLRND